MRCCSAFCINLAMVDGICDMRYACSVFISVDSRTTLFLPLLCHIKYTPTIVERVSCCYYLFVCCVLCAVCIFHSSICNALNMRFDCCVMFYVSTFDYVLLVIFEITHFKLSCNNNADVNWYTLCPPFRLLLNNYAMQFPCSFVRFAFSLWCLLIILRFFPVGDL